MLPVNYLKKCICKTKYLSPKLYLFSRCTDLNIWLILYLKIINFWKSTKKNVNVAAILDTRVQRK